MLLMLSAAAQHTNLAQALTNLDLDPDLDSEKFMLSKLQLDPAQRSGKVVCHYMAVAVGLGHQRSRTQYLHSTAHVARYIYVV